MHPYRKGFSLIEIIVGLAMGMVSMVVIMQVFSVFEGGKRTTTGGADAQSNGAISLYMIERDVRMAGWGLGATSYAGCNSIYSYCDGSASCGGGAAGAIGGLSFASVRITDGGTGPDGIAAQYFAQPNMGEFNFPSSTKISDTMPRSSAELEVENVNGCTKKEDEGEDVSMMAIVSQGGACTLMKITHVQGQALKLQHNPGADGEYNPPANYQNEHNWPAYTRGATVSCFRAAGNAPVFQRSYAIDANRQLLRSDNTGATVVTNEPVAPEIFDLQAQYGIAPVGSQAVGDDDWVDATGATWAAPTATDLMRIKAVRVALVARSSQYEKPETGSACVTTTEEMVETWSSWATFDTSSYPSDWQCYRYKVFETVVPLRNVIWGNL